MCGRLLVEVAEYDKNDNACMVSGLSIACFVIHAGSRPKPEWLVSWFKKTLRLRSINSYISSVVSSSTYIIWWRC